MTLILSIGHSGSTGATANGREEREFLTEIVKNRFYDLQKEYKVLLMPDHLNLIPRINAINNIAKKGDIAIDLHLNAASPTATGAEIFFDDRKWEYKNMANVILNAYCNETEFVNRGAKPDSDSQHDMLAFCRHLNIKGYVLELGFITNKNDIKKLKDKGYEGIEAILKVLNLNRDNMSGKKTFDELIGWQKDAVQFVKDTVKSNRDVFGNTINDIELFEMTRKILLYIDKHYEKKVEKTE